MRYRIVLPDTRPEEDPEALLKLQQDLLAWAEELFGERDMTWNLLPPMFGDRNPHVFYPDPESLNLVMVKLGRGAREKWTFALYQMAHEVVHLLNPKRGRHANNLEEGAACAFSYYVQRICGITGSRFVRHSHSKYEYVHNLVKRLPSAFGEICHRVPLFAMSY